MEIKRDNTDLQILLEADLTSGSAEFIDYVLHTLQKKSGMEEDIFKFAGSNLVQIDLGIGTEQVYRLHFYRNNSESGITTHMNVFLVDERGFVIGDSFTLRNYSSDKGTTTYLDGSSDGSIEGGDLSVTSRQFVERIESAFDHLNDFNWKIDGGLMRSEGQI